MATLGPFSTTNKYLKYRIYVDEVGVFNNENYSDVRVRVGAYKESGTNASTYGTGTIYVRINGGVHSAGITSNQKILSEIEVFNQTVRVYHNNDGSYTLPVTAWFSHSQFSSSEQGGNVGLTHIPRQAGVSNVTSSGLKGTFTYNWTSNTSAYWYRARISIPNVLKIKDINLGQQNGGKSNTFTFSTSELTAILNSVSNTSSQVTIGVVIETHTSSNYSSKLGESSEAMVTVAIPTTISVSTPTGKDTNSTIVNLTGNANYLIQNKSNLVVTVSASSVADCATTTKKAVITKYEVTVNGETKTLTSAGTLDFGVVSSGSNLIGTLKVTDSRKNTKSVTFTVNVIPYTPPTISIDNCYRCDSNGTENVTTGTYAYIKSTFSVCSIKILGVEKNAIKSRTLKIDETVKSSSFSSGVGAVYGTISSTKHAVEVLIDDVFGSENISKYELTSALLPFVISENKKSIGFGGVPTKDSQFYIGFDEINIKGNIQPIFELVGTVNVEI